MLQNSKGRRFLRQHLENDSGMFLRPPITEEFFFIYKIFSQCYMIAKEEHRQSNMKKMFSEYY